MAELKVTTSGCNLENDNCSKRLNAINHCSPESGFLFDPKSIQFCLEAEWQVETMHLSRLIVNSYHPVLKHSFEGVGPLSMDIIAIPFEGIFKEIVAVWVKVASIPQTKQMLP